ncbi:MFS transporter, CP family, cyanate transporter [Oceanobacillus limi]|uniref:MFS transporter, CP family, cyanate transporter n=1 Tax=Oceanobacillus limi TaxID=930131 RepID=A0A1I0BPX5_9BACI|nr:MFS transporter [Oceanobacillus limi]SET08329.1 MFS transporter, CP family, cyanate transporter [Oceanobacillus limi]
METQQTIEKENQLYRFFIIIGIIIVAFNLRPAITSVGPLIGIIRDEIGLSNWSVGLLTSLPLIAFAIMSPIAPRLSNRLTNERALLIGLALLTIGIFVRSISVILLIFAGTLFVGLGIAICNVLLPSVVKEKFPAKVGLMTSVYSTAMGIFAAGSSGVSVPLAKGMDLGWQVALLVWSIPAIVGILIWFYLSMKGKAGASETAVNYVQTSENRMWRSPLAWQVAVYMGLQSFLFYVTISWLPEILHDYGVTMETAGWMLSFTQFVGLPASFLVPVIAGKLQSQRSIVLVMGTLAITGYGGLLLGSSTFIMVVSTIFIGFALSGSFALALSFLAMRARTGKQAAELSGMAQAFGYSLAAFGPMFIGYLYDVTHVWNVPLITLMIVAGMVMMFGMGAGRNRYVL